MANKRTTLIVLAAVSAGLLLVSQFVNWFQTSTTIPSSNSGGFGFGGGSYSTGFNAWSVNGNAGGYSISQSWLDHLGKDGSTWQSTLMALAGPLLLAAVILSGISILPLTQGKTRLMARLNLIAGACAGLAVLFGFLYNYVHDGDQTSLDLFVGVFLLLAGTAVAFVTAYMANTAMAGDVPGPMAPTTNQPPVNR